MLIYSKYEYTRAKVRNRSVSRRLLGTVTEDFDHKNDIQKDKNSFSLTDVDGEKLFLHFQSLKY